MTRKDPTNERRVEPHGLLARVPRAARFAGGTALAVGLGASGYAVAGAVTTAGSASASLDSASTATPPSTPSSPSTVQPGGPVQWPGGSRPTGVQPGGPVLWPGEGGGPGGPPFGPAGRHGALLGTVTSTGSGTITLTTPAGTSVTVTVNTSTTYRQGPKALASNQVLVGEDVAVLPTSATAGSSSPTAAAVLVVGPRIEGRVVSVTGQTVVVADAQGFYRTIVTSSSTSVTEAGTASGLNAVTPGTQIAATGTIAADHTDLDATAIRIVLPRVVGKVTAVDTATGTITLATPPSSGTTTVTTTSTTTFRKGTASTTLSAIPIGSFVVATGTPGAGNTFAALKVVVGPTGAAHPAHGPWRDGHSHGVSAPAGGAGPASTTT